MTDEPLPFRQESEFVALNLESSYSFETVFKQQPLTHPSPIRQKAEGRRLIIQFFCLTATHAPRTALAWSRINKLENYFLLIANVLGFDSNNDSDIDVKVL
jgi:hypothetical protein